MSGMLDNISMVMGSRNCPNCGARMPIVRMPHNPRELLVGGSTCQRCGVETDRKGNIRSQPEDRG